MSFFTPRTLFSAIARTPRLARPFSSTPRLANAGGPVSSIPSLASFAGSTTSREPSKLSSAQSDIATSFLRNALPTSSSSANGPEATSPTAESWWRETYQHRTYSPPGTQYTGRSLPVPPRSGDSGLAQAMRRLNGILVRNRVKRELKLGEYYEKPSERKKRLAVERHRRRFQDLVRQKVQLVQAVRNRS